jgi:hypothetical protein
MTDVALSAWFPWAPLLDRFRVADYPCSGFLGDGAGSLSAYHELCELACFLWRL